LRLPVTESPAGPWIDRFASVLLVGLAGVFVALLLRIQPDARGHGTHEQLGLPACAWPEVYGKPCPTCGVTTAASHLVHLQPLAAIATQPFGAFLAGLGLFAAGVAALSLLRRESLVARVAFLPYGRLLAIGLILFFASWGYTWWTWPAK
jgi:hypothetical protein